MLNQYVRKQWRGLKYASKKGVKEMEYLNFDEISKKVKFAQVLDWLDIPHTETDLELKGQGFIVNRLKNIYFNPTGTDKGSVINFVSATKGADLRTAAKMLKDQFLTEEKPAPETKRPIPTLELEYHPYLEEIAPADLCKDLNVGFCKQKSIMNGRICFKVGEHYIGYSPEKKDWFFPKGFKRDTLWNIDNCDQDTIFITHDPFTALKMIVKGYPNTASMMGQSLTEEQRNVVKGYKYIFFG